LKRGPFHTDHYGRAGNKRKEQARNENASWQRRRIAVAGGTRRRTYSPRRRFTVSVRPISAYWRKRGTRFRICRDGCECRGGSRRAGYHGALGWSFGTGGRVESHAVRYRASRGLPFRRQL
jgi:hypothetical protein